MACIKHFEQSQAFWNFYNLKEALKFKQPLNQLYLFVSERKFTSQNLKT